MKNQIVKVRYANGSLYHGPLVQAPIYKVQTVAYIDRKTGEAQLRHQGDFYFLAQDGSIIPADVLTVASHMVDAGEQPTDTMSVRAWAAKNGYLIGTFIGLHDWQKVYQAGKADRDSLRRDK